MPRLADLDPDRLDSDQRQLYEQIMAGPLGRVRGPLQIWMRSPHLAASVIALGEYIRFGSKLPERLAEIAILVTARAHNAAYEWSRHFERAAAAGVPLDAMEAIARRKRPSFQDPRDQVAHDVAHALVTGRRLDAATYETAMDTLGEVMLVELVGAIGFYCLVSMTLIAFDLEAPDGGPMLPA